MKQKVVTESFIIETTGDYYFSNPKIVDKDRIIFTEFQNNILKKILVMNLYVFIGLLNNLELH